MAETAQDQDSDLCLRLKLQAFLEHSSPSLGILAGRSRRPSNLPLSRSGQGLKGSINEMRAGCSLGKSVDSVSMDGCQFASPC